MKSKTPFTILLLSVAIAAVVTNVGCSSIKSADEKFNAWESETFKRAVKSHDNVVLVRVYESQLQRNPLPHKNRIDSKATVVCIYKGAWHVGESMTFYREMETVPQDWKPNVGGLSYLLFDKRTPEPIGIDTGEDWAYKTELERALRR